LSNGHNANKFLPLYIMHTCSIIQKIDTYAIKIKKKFDLFKNPKFFLSIYGCNYLRPKAENKEI